MKNKLKKLSLIGMIYSITATIPACCMENYKEQPNEIIKTDSTKALPEEELSFNSIPQEVRQYIMYLALKENFSFKCYKTLLEHTKLIFSVAFSPSGKLFATASFDGTARLWDTKTGQCIHTLKGHSDHCGCVTAVVFSPNENLVATASWDNTARLWNTITGQCNYVLQGHTGYVYSVAFSPME